MAQIQLQKVRLAFPQLFQAKAINNGSARYSAALIIDPKSQASKDIRAQMLAAAKGKFGDDKGEAVLAKLTKENRVCYRTEERANKEGDVYEGFQGMHSLNAANKVRPLVIDADKSPLTAEDGRPYAGCYVNAIVEIWAQNNPDPTIGRRLNCTLLGVQFAGDGDAFGGASVASVDAFSAVSTGSDADDLI